MAFCMNCGKQLPDGAKFCFECGVPVMQTSKNQEHATAQTGERHQEYVGTILKCSNCGGVVSETTAVCSTCGMRITRKNAVSSVRDFKLQLMELEGKRKQSVLGIFSLYAPVDPVDKQKLSLIQNFPIPNTVDDILEFVLLAIANIDTSLSKKTWMNSSQSMQVLAVEMPKVISNAWVSKLQQAYQKAELLFPNDPAFSGIQKLYQEKMRELKIKI